MNLFQIPLNPTEISNKYEFLGGNQVDNESSKSTKFSLSPQINDLIEGTKTPLESADSKEVSNEEEDVHAEQREHIKEIISSYDDSDSEDDQISSESEDEIIENMEQVAADMKSEVEFEFV